jgi:hypothetical protein
MRSRDTERPPEQREVGRLPEDEVKVEHKKKIGCSVEFPHYSEMDLQQFGNDRCRCKKCR